VSAVRPLLAKEARNGVPDARKGAVPKIKIPALSQRTRQGRGNLSLFRQVWRPVTRRTMEYRTYFRVRRNSSIMRSFPLSSMR
jgi:hypothetical protein